MSTAYEIALRSEIYYQTVLIPVSNAWSKTERRLYDQWMRVWERIEREHDLELTRMADDGCPLFS